MSEESQEETPPTETVLSPRPILGERPFLVLERGATVGRYVVIDQVGQGGMGVVYAGYDPELDRKVALKLLRPDRASGEAARMRLLREAQAIARLSHPNVVAVHDAGTIGDQVFVAMEFVEGTTLREWLREKSRTWREVADRFVLAGRGLAAAHAAGLVHRDFKPDNVLLGRDGQVRVADFGIARAAGEEMEAAPPSGSGSILTSPLTEWGVAMGTPAYMAPEQRRDGSADARSDQFSFCVALWEALYKERPSAAPREPAGTEVPGRLREVLLRGLAADPEARYPSMDELLRDLVRDPGGVRRRWLIAAALVFLGGAAFAGLGYFQARSGQLCGGAEEKLSAVWNGERKAAVHRAFAATGVPYAEETWTRVADSLDRYGSEWASTHREACEATRVRGEQSEDLLDRRMLCLDQRLEEVGALAGLFARADSQVVKKAADAVVGLPGLGGCSEVATLMGREPLAKDPEVRARVVVIRRRLAEAKALQMAGKYKEAFARLKGVDREAAGLGYHPLEGQALFQIAELRENLGEFAEAEAGYYQALGAAEEGRDDVIRANCWKKLVYVVGYRQARYDEAHRLARQAQAVIRRLGGKPGLEAALLSTQGSILTFQGKYREALATYERALELQRQGGESQPQAYVLASNVGIVHFFLGDLEKALAQYRQALALAEKEIGPSHPATAALRYNIGDALNSLGRTAEAREHLLRALADREKALGPRHVDVAESLLALGANAIAEDRLDQALTYLERAQAIYDEADGPALYVALCHNILGSTLTRLGRFPEARTHFEASVAGFETISGKDGGFVAGPLGGLAEILLEQGRPEAALPLLERARSNLEKTPVFPDWVARIDFLLARALRDSGGDEERALALARRAREIWRDDPGSRRDLAKVDAWLAGNGVQEMPRG
jgi:tetratricopeptide (TPR) repeat protein/predicted Ser/Thr protein kinase